MVRQAIAYEPTHVHRTWLYFLIYIIISGLLFSSLIQSVNAAEFKRYDEVEYVVAQNLAGFTGLLNRAKTQTVRLALMG